MADDFKAIAESHIDARQIKFGQLHPGAGNTPPIDPDLLLRINKELDRVEQEKGVEILYAADSGLHARRTARPQDGRDVLFVYDPRQSTAEAIFRSLNGDETRLVGWSVDAALRAAARASRELIESLDGPVIYRDDERLCGLLCKTLQKASPHDLAQHYARDGCGEAEVFQCDDTPLVPAGNYLRALYPLLCLEWMCLYGWAVPPVRIDQLLADLKPAIGVGLHGLALRVLQRHRAGNDAPLRVPELNRFIAGLAQHAPRVAERAQDSGMERSWPDDPAR